MCVIENVVRMQVLLTDVELSCPLAPDALPLPTMPLCPVFDDASQRLQRLCYDAAGITSFTESSLTECKISFVMLYDDESYQLT